MYTDPFVGDLVYHKSLHRVFKVVEVNSIYGWFIAGDNLGFKYRYTTGTKGNQTFVKMSREEVADYYLEMARSGASDSWLED